MGVGSASDDREIGADRDITHSLKEIAIGGEDLLLESPGVRHDIKSKDVGGPTGFRSAIIGWCQNDETIVADINFKAKMRRQTCVRVGEQLNFDPGVEGQAGLKDVYASGYEVEWIGWSFPDKQEIIVEIHGNSEPLILLPIGKKELRLLTRRGRLGGQESPPTEKYTDPRQETEE